MKRLKPLIIVLFLISLSTAGLVQSKVTITVSTCRGSYPPKWVHFPKMLAAWITQWRVVLPLPEVGRLMPMHNSQAYGGLGNPPSIGFGKGRRTSSPSQF